MKIKRFLQAIAVNLVICLFLPLSLNATAHASTTQKQNITFYIDNQIINSDKATIRLVHGYTDHPSLKNLYTGNNKITVPEGTYTLSVIVNDGYIFDFSHGVTPDIILKNAKRSPIRTFIRDTLITTHTYINDIYQNQTIVLSGEITKDYRKNYEVSEERFYSYHPEYKDKEFKYEFNRDPDDRYSYSITRNGKPLSPDDKLKVGDKLRITQHYYAQDSIQTDVFFEDVPFVYNDSGELYADYTITVNNFPSEYGKRLEDCVANFSAGGGSCTTVFTNWKGKVNITTNCEAGGSFNMYLVTLDRSNKETLTKLNNNMRIVPGNRFKLEPIPVTGWQFDRWNVEGGIITANNYFIVTDDTVNIAAVFTKKHDIVSPSLGGDTSNPSTTPNTPNTTDPRLELALEKAKYALSLAEENLRKANVALTNARKKTSYVFDGNGFTQVADTNAIKEAELDVQRAEITYREAELNYQQVQALISNSASSLYGDVDGDGEISFLDVEELITLFLNDAPYSQKYDLDKSGYLDFDDVSTMITIFLNSIG